MSDRLTMDTLHRKRTVLMAAGAILVLASIFVVGALRRAAPGRAIAVAPEASDRAEQDLRDGVAPRVEDPSVLASADSGSSEIEEQLARFYGADWPARRKFPLDQGIRIEGRPPLAPWEEVEAILGEKLLLLPGTREHILAASIDWPDELTNEWFQQRFSHGFELSDLDRTELEALVQPLHAELRTVVERYLDDIDEAIAHQFSLGKYIRAPITTLGIPRPPPEGHFFANGQSHGGWTCALSLAEADFPHIVRAGRDIEDRKRHRNQAVRAHLEAIRKHH